MSAQLGNKRKRQEGGSKNKRVLPRKSSRRAAAYHSSSEDDDEDVPETLANLEDGPDGGVELLDDSPNLSEADDVQLPNFNLENPLTGVNATQRRADSDEDSDGSEDAGSDADSDGDSDLASTTPSTTHNRKNRNDPARFATSINKILTSKLTTTKRADPVLSRSAAATSTSLAFSESKLDAKARRKLRDDKRSALERGRIRDVLGIEGKEGGRAQETAEAEKKLRKMAQRGVVKLFNAVRAAQVKGEDADRDARGVGVGGTGLVGSDRRKERVNEMSKKGFLDLLVES